MTILVTRARTAIISSSARCCFSSRTSSSPSDANAQISRALYRNLIRWCRSTGPEFPLDKTHLFDEERFGPVDLEPPRVDAIGLQKLASDANNTSRNYCEYQYIRNLLPEGSAIHNDIMLVPVRRAPELAGFIRAVFRLNAVSSKENTGECDPKIIQERISFGFTIVQTLNELGVTIDKYYRPVIEGRAVDVPGLGLLHFTGKEGEKEEALESFNRIKDLFETWQKGPGER